MRQADLVNWYLKEMEHEIESEAELVERKNLVEKVIHKLVHVVSGRLRVCAWDSSAGVAWSHSSLSVLGSYDLCVGDNV